MTLWQVRSSILYHFVLPLFTFHSVQKCPFLWNVNGDFTLDLWVERCYRLGVISCNEASFGNIGNEEHLLKLATQSLATNYAKYFKPFPKYLLRNPKIEESTFILFHILTSSLSGFSIEWIIRHLLKNLSHQSLSTIFIIIFLFSTRIQNFFLFSKWYGNWNTKARAGFSPKHFL